MIFSQPSVCEITRTSIVSLDLCRIDARMRLFAEQPEQASRQEHRNRNEPECRFHRAAEMRGDAQAERADAVTQVAPEAVDADGGAAPVGMGDVGHGGGEVGVQQRHAEAGDGGGERPPRHAFLQQHHCHASTADPHAPQVGLVATDMVG